MAIFRIISASSQKGSSTTVFRVCLEESGTPTVGERFTCFDTHHPFEYLIQSITKLGVEIYVLDCDGSLGFENQFFGARLDTNNRSTPARFRYDTKADA